MLCVVIVIVVDDRCMQMAGRLPIQSEIPSEPGGASKGSQRIHVEAYGGTTKNPVRLSSISGRIGIRAGGDEISAGGFRS